MKTLQFTNAELALLFDAVDLMNDKERDMTNDEIALLTVDQSLNHGERMKKIDELVERTRALTALRQRLTFAVQGNDELTSKTVCREDRMTRLADEMRNELSRLLVDNDEIAGMAVERLGSDIGEDAAGFDDAVEDIVRDIIRRVAV
ncbi:hypothetical protein DPMD02_1 [Desulfofustis phage LS06-2018-MD02]|jgi:hypothetical protein|nr:hypothetical protein DPMD02_1 [Desulfofustis phage LS06-2018-MD02]